MSRSLATTAGILLLAASALPQGPAPLLLAGDALPDGGPTITAIETVHVAYGGAWVTKLTTAAPENATVILVFYPLLNGWFTWKQEGDAVPSLPGTTVADVGNTSGDILGAVYAMGRLDGTAGGAADDEVLFFENSVLAREGTLMPDGVSTYGGFGDVSGATSSGGAFFRGHMDDPAIPGSDETYLMTAIQQGSFGAFAIDRIVWDGQPAPGLSEIIASIRVAPIQGALSPSGSRIVWSCDLRGDPDTDGCVFRYAHLPGGAHDLLAREGSPSPVPGRRWGPLENPAVAVNSAGSWTLRAKLDEPDPDRDTVLVKDDEVVAWEGESLPSIAPDVVTGFGRDRAFIDELGRVVWYARLSGPEGASEAILRDDQVLVRTGVTRIGGRTLLDIRAHEQAMSISRSGEQLLFTGTLAGGVRGAFILTGL